MSTESLKQLHQLMNTDQALAQRFNQLTTIEDTIKLAEELGYTITKEDIRSYHEDLSDVELEEVIGGFKIKETICQNNIGRATERECYSYMNLDK